MTNKISDKIGQLKCPFCGAELKGWEEKHLGEFWTCANDKCAAFGKLKGTFSIWQALINAQDALKRAKEIYVRDVAWWQCRCDSYDGDGQIERFFDKDITSITKQE